MSTKTIFKLQVAALLLTSIPAFADALGAPDSNCNPGVNPPVTGGCTWYNFYALMDGTITAGSSSQNYYVKASNPPWTITTSTATVLRVLDGGHQGDTFQAYDNGVLLGTTSSTPIDANHSCANDPTGAGTDPAACWNDPLMSQGTFQLAAGSHTITIVWSQKVPGGDSALQWFEIGAASASTGTPTLRSTNPIQDAVNNLPQIVPGAWVSAYGTSLANTTKDWSDQTSVFAAGNLPTTVAGVQVLVNGNPVPVWYVTQTQVNFQAPSNISGNATVQIINNGQTSNVVNVPVVSVSPGVIAYSSNYTTYYPSAELAGTTTIIGDPSVVQGVQEAKPGNQIQLYVTGLAPTTAGTVINSPIVFSTPITVNLGSTNLTPSYVGQIGPGYYQVNFMVPSSMSSGNYPFSISIGGKNSQSNVVFPVTQ